MSERSGVAESPSTQYGPSVVVVPCVQVVLPLLELVVVPVLDVDDVVVDVDELEVEDDEVEELVELLAIVVTGKGRASSWMDEPGVLRRLTPHWLRAPDLRNVVLGFEEAGRAHGGAGALYVRLRRPR